VCQPTEQLLYARWLDLGARLGLVMLVLLFPAYVLGWLVPQVPVQRLPELWSLPVADYLRATGATGGWQWVGQLRHGDNASLAGIAVLAGCSVPGLAALLPGYWRRGDKVYVVLAVAEMAVVLLAASGRLAGGH
jgi:hypothetical protein